MFLPIFRSAGYAGYWGRRKVALQSEAPQGAEVYRFPVAALILVPLVALVLQALLPLYFRSISVLNLPLLLVIYFALARRSALAGIFSGAVIGLAQDSLSRDPIGLYAITATVTGFLASVVSSRMEVENSGLRFIVISILYYIQFFVVYALDVGLLGQGMELSPGATAAAALVNGLTGVVLFKVLDRFRKPA